MVVRAIGRQAKDTQTALWDQPCEMVAGVEMHLCSRINSKSGQCTCTGEDGKTSQLIYLKQETMLTKPKQNPLATCGKWYVGVSTTISMLVGNLRSMALQAHPILQQCVSKDKVVKAKVSPAKKKCGAPKV